MPLELSLASRPEDWNMSEVVAEITAQNEHYKGLVYTEKDIPDAKKDRAAMKKILDAVQEGKRTIKRKKEQEAKEQIEALFKPLEAAVDALTTTWELADKQIKEYEQLEKDRKQLQIETLFQSMGFPAWVQLDKVQNKSWLNKSATLSTIEQSLQIVKINIQSDLDTIRRLPEEIAFEAERYYEQTMDRNRAIDDATRMAEINKAKEQARKPEKATEPVAVEMPAEPVKEAESSAEAVRVTLRFECKLTNEDALALREFFDRRSIDWEVIG